MPENNYRLENSYAYWFGALQSRIELLIGYGQLDPKNLMPFLLLMEKSGTTLEGVKEFADTLKQLIKDQNQKFESA